MCTQITIFDAISETENITVGRNIDSNGISFYFDKEKGINTANENTHLQAQYEQQITINSMTNNL